jgi:hypothetical protein
MVTAGDRTPECIIRPRQAPILQETGGHIAIAALQQKSQP